MTPADQPAKTRLDRVFDLGGTLAVLGVGVGVFGAGVAVAIATLRWAFT